MNRKVTHSLRLAVLLLVPWSLGGSLFSAQPDISKLPPPISRQIDFTTDIKPIFEASCLRCHGAEKPKGKFSLVSREAALKGGNEGIDIFPGDSAKSPLIHYVARLVPEMEMPPVDKGDPLTTEQIALLRAWIDQGAPWEQTDWRAPYSPQFSFTPAVRYVTVSGNGRKFEEHQWVRRGFSAGVSDFRVAQKLTNGVSVVAEGRALPDDYKITIDIRKEDVGFARSGFEQFTRYYDDHGPYHPFPASGFSSPTRPIFSLHRDTQLDIGQAFIEFGLTVPDWPRAVIGYELHYRIGEESTLQWGSVSSSTNAASRRHIYPARRQVNDEIHLLRLDVSHDVAGVHIEDNVRFEFSDLGNSRANALEFPAGAAYPGAFTITRESHEQVQFANALHGEKSLKDWLFVSAGYLFSEFDADATLKQRTADGGGRTLSPLGSARIKLEDRAHVFSGSALLGPWDTFTVSLGVQNEWTTQNGTDVHDLSDSDPDDPTGGGALVPGSATNQTIRSTVLFIEARLKQERASQFEESFGDQDFLRDTDAKFNWQEYKAGMDVSPWRWFALHTSYTHRQRNSRYEHDRDEEPHGTSPGDGYPAFIRSRDTDGDSVQTRLTIRPAHWLRATLGYRVAMTDFHTVTDPTLLLGGAATTGGHVFAGEQDSATYSAALTITPARRWYISTTFSYQESETKTVANGNPSIVPYRGDVYSAVASSTFALSTSTDLRGSYSFSRARFGQHHFASGLPLGIDSDLHGVQLGVTHRVNTNTTAGLQYGFYKYQEPTAHGFNDYTAHLVFGTLTVRWP